MFDIIKGILIIGKELIKANFERFKKTPIYIKSNLTDSDWNMHLTVDSLKK